MEDYVRYVSFQTGGSAVPSWLQSLIKSREAYVVEESMVDVREGVMATSTQNVSHRRFMSIEELQIFTRSTESIFPNGY